MNKGRLDFIDVGKGIGILILITITHNFFLPDSILNFDGYILMPFFIFLSGFVFSVRASDTFFLFIKRKFKAYIIPYIVFVLMGFFFTLIINHSNQIQPLTEIKYLLHALVNGTPENLNRFYVNPLWFVFSLFFVVILYYLIYDKNIFIRYGIIVGLLLISIALNSQKINFKNSYFANIDVVFVALPFFDLGFLFSKLKLEFKSWQMLLLFIIFFLFAFYLSGIFSARVILAYNVIPNYLIFLLISTAGVLFLFFLSKMIKYNKYLVFIGKNSFTIFGLHWIVLHGILYRLFGFFYKGPFNTWIDEHSTGKYFLPLIFSALQLLIIVPLIKPINLFLNKVDKMLNI
jgi:fucose 4-O-acetylase-like acetyltransferase